MSRILNLKIDFFTVAGIIIIFQNFKLMGLRTHIEVVIYILCYYIYYFQGQEDERFCCWNNNPRSF